MNRLRTVAIGIAALLAVTITTSATPPPARATSVDLLLPMMFRTSSPTEYAVFDDDLLLVGRFPIDEAKRKTGWVHVDKLSEPTHVVFADGSCLTNVPDGASQRAAKRACAPGDQANQMWTVGPSSMSIAKAVVPARPVLTYAFATADGLTMRAAGAEYTTYVGASNIQGPLRARVNSVDSDARSAVMGGSARPNSTLLVDDDVTRRVPVAANGAWTYTATGLQPGDNAVTFDEYSGSVKSASIVLDVHVDAPVSTQMLRLDAPADPSAGYEANAAYTFRGHANPKAATVHIENSKGTNLTDVPVDPSTGAWAWTRADMGTTVWRLTFSTMKGTALEETVGLTDFAPKP